MNRSGPNRSLEILSALAVLLALSCSTVDSLDTATTNSNASNSVPPAAESMPQNFNSNASIPEATALPAEPTPRSFSIVKKGGWFRLDKSKLETKQSRTKVEDYGIYFTRYSPKSPMKVSLKCDKTIPAEQCGHYWLGWDYYAEQLNVYESNHKAFKVIAHLHRIDQLDSLAIHTIAFFDNDGDGTFETVSSSDNWSIPRWARK